MSAHRASRSVVREALTLLRAEHLIDRTQGIGTTSRARVNDALLVEAHGHTVDASQRVLLAETRPRLLDRSLVPMPGEAATALGISPGEQCLRLEYVSLVREEPSGLATNYVRFPEAEAIRRTPFVKDWYTLMVDAGVRSWESRFVIGCSQADELVASHLQLDPGDPVMTLEQVIHDEHGRPFDWAYVVIRADRFRFISWSGSEQGRFDERSGS
jgi:GntR family transcriptional regulator